MKKDLLLYRTEYYLSKKLVDSWRKAVDRDLKQEEFTELEKTTLTNKEGERALRSIEKNPYLAYGSTLLAAIVTDRFIIYLQLGDGDILRVAIDGETTKPLKKDPNLIGNETTSLCMKDSWTYFEVILEEVDPHNKPEKMPALIMVATDGYSNSYSSDENFFTIGSGYLDLISKEGIDFVEGKLEEFLTETTAGGSGDDITLGMIVQNPIRLKQLSKAPIRTRQVSRWFKESRRRRGSRRRRNL